MNPQYAVGTGFHQLSPQGNPAVQGAIRFRLWSCDLAAKSFHGITEKARIGICQWLQSDCKVYSDTKGKPIVRLGRKALSPPKADCRAARDPVSCGFPEGRRFNRTSSEGVP